MSNICPGNNVDILMKMAGVSCATKFVSKDTSMKLKKVKPETIQRTQRYITETESSNITVKKTADQSGSQKNENANGMRNPSRESSEVSIISSTQLKPCVNSSLHESSSQSKDSDVAVETMSLDEITMSDVFKHLDSECQDWTSWLSKLSKMINSNSTEKMENNIKVLIKFKLLEKMNDYIKTNDISLLKNFLSGDAGRVTKFWPTLKRLFIIIWIACDQSVNFCQHFLISDMFQYFVMTLKSFTGTTYELDEAKVFTVKACLGIFHNVSRHLPNRKWQLRNEGLLSASQPYLTSSIPIIRLKTLIILSYILSEAENEMINSNDDNFLFIFEVLKDSLKMPDHRSSKFGMTAAEVLKGVNNLAINDENKLRIVKNGALDLYQDILGCGTSEEIKVTITTLWSLAFNHYNKARMREMSQIMNKLCELQQHPDEEISHAARGTFWELENTSRSCIEKHSSSSLSTDDMNQPHIMISYQWDCQAIMLKVKERLRQAGYKVWMDVEHMTGSTLEAMALAVEKAAVILVCMSQKYKDSPNCRTEAEYVYRLRKDFIPLRLQHEYVPDGWLGILVGTRLYFDVYTENLLEAQIPRLVKELRDRGKIAPAEECFRTQVVPLEMKRLTSREAVPVLQQANSTEVSYWTCQDIKYWLASHSLEQLQDVFENINGGLLAELSKIQLTSPEYFHQILRTDFHLSVYDALRLSRAIRML